MKPNVTLALAFALAASAGLSAQTTQSTQPSPPGVVIIDDMENFDHWTWNQDVTPVLDKSMRKIGNACINVQFLIDKTKPNAAWIARTGVGLDRVPKYLQAFVLVPRWQKFAWGEARIRMIVQDADGTAVMTFISGLYEGTDGRDSPIFAKPWYYVWPKIRVELASFEPYWPGTNGTLDGIETISFEMPHRVEEYMFDGPYEYRIDELAAIFDDADPYIADRAAAVRQRGKALLQQLDGLRETHQGTWYRYPLASLTALDVFCDWAVEETQDPEKKWVRAERELIYLDRLCDDLAAGFDRLEKGENPWPDVAEPDVTALTVENGNYRNEQGPVYITGFCHHPSNLGIFRRLGLNGTTLGCTLGETRPEPDVTNKPENLVTFCDNAAKHNIACDLLITPHHAPGWALAKWPDICPSNLRRVRNQFLPWNLSSPNFRNLVAEHAEAVATTVRDCKNLLSYDLTNELWYLMLGDFAADDFRAWLKQRYETVDALNQAWGTTFENFETVQYLTAVDRAVSDLFLFNQDRVTDFYTFFVNEVRKHDDTKPVYIKIHGAWRHLMSVDKPALCRVLTGVGSDCFSRLDNPDDDLVMDLWTTMMITNMYHSLEPDKPMIDSEQHMIWYGHVVTYDYIRALCWWRAVQGLDANYVWLWNRTFENAEDNLCTQPWAMVGLCETALDLQRLNTLVADFQAYRPDVLLVDSGAKTPDAYKLLSYAGRAFNLLTPQALTDDRLKTYKTIIFPDGYRIDDQTPQWLAAAEKAQINVIQIDDQTTTRSLAQRIVSRATPIAENIDGVINHTVLDPAGRTMTFLLNINTEPVRVRLAPPAEGQWTNPISRETVGETIELRPSVPVILTM